MYISLLCIFFLILDFGSVRFFRFYFFKEPEPTRTKVGSKFLELDQPTFFGSFKKNLQFQSVHRFGSVPSGTMNDPMLGSLNRVSSPL